METKWNACWTSTSYGRCRRAMGAGILKWLRYATACLYFLSTLSVTVSDCRSNHSLGSNQDVEGPLVHKQRVEWITIRNSVVIGHWNQWTLDMSLHWKKMITAKWINLPFKLMEYALLVSRCTIAIFAHLYHLQRWGQFVLYSEAFSRFAFLLSSCLLSSLLSSAIYVGIFLCFFFPSTVHWPDRDCAQNHGQRRCEGPIQQWNPLDFPSWSSD